MRARHHPEVPWGSFADALSGMLFVFILTTFWFAWQLAKAEQGLKEKTTEILSAKQMALALTAGDPQGPLTLCLEEGGHIEAVPQRDEPRISLYVPKDIWFPSGSATLGEKPRAAVDRIWQCVSDLLDDEKLKGAYRIRVYLEGHTDSTPVRGGAESNWELSGRRSAVVVRRALDASASTDTLPVAERIRRAIADDDLDVVAVGMADLKPAWRRLCAPSESLGSDDRGVCDALARRADETDGIDAADTAENAERQLRDLLLSGSLLRLDHSCREDETVLGELTTPELVRLWANRCPDPVTDPAAARGETRRAFLRRVDLRLELLPRVDEEQAS